VKLEPGHVATLEAILADAMRESVLARPARDARIVRALLHGEMRKEVARRERLSPGYVGRIKDRVLLHAKRAGFVAYAFEPGEYGRSRDQPWRLTISETDFRSRHVRPDWIEDKCRADPEWVQRWAEYAGAKLEVLRLEAPATEFKLDDLVKIKVGRRKQDFRVSAIEPYGTTATFYLARVRCW
jgi:hypothetical protein